MSVATGTAIAIGAGVAAVGGVTAAVISSNAAKGAGEATLSAAQQQVALAQQALSAQIQARASGISTAQSAAAMSPGEINSITKILDTQGQSLEASMASLKKQQSALDSMDPSVKAAGSNLYSLLTGKAADVLAPLQKQQEFQRNQLVSQLSSQMGPGFMASSAGIMALTQFDNQAALTLNNAQLSAIQTVGAEYGNLTGIQQQGQSAITSGTLNAFNQTQAANTTALQGYESAATRSTSATIGAMQANPINPFGVPNAQESVVGAAGGPYAGAGVLGQSVGNTAGSVANVFGQYGAAGMQSDNLKNLFAGMQGTQPGGYSGNFGATIATPSPSPNLGINYSMPGAL